jgi:hypothetical protein
MTRSRTRRSTVGRFLSDYKRTLVFHQDDSAGLVSTGAILTITNNLLTPIWVSVDETKSGSRDLRIGRPPAVLLKPGQVHFLSLFGKCTPVTGTGTETRLSSGLIKIKGDCTFIYWKDEANSEVKVTPLREEKCKFRALLPIGSALDFTVYLQIESLEELSHHG